MKQIQLYTARADNSGQRHEAGDKVAVGDGKAEIAESRAKAMVDGGEAADLTPLAKTSKKDG